MARWPHPLPGDPGGEEGRPRGRAQGAEGAPGQEKEVRVHSNLNSGAGWSFIGDELKGELRTGLAGDASLEAALGGQAEEGGGVG